MQISWRSVGAGSLFGLLTALGPWFQGLSFQAAALFSTGLFLTYTSIGLLVAVLPSFSPKYLAGALWGLIYSLPGAVFTAVPYPLTADAPAYYREFAGGGLRASVLTLLFGALAGGVAGLFHRSRA
ncbi:hypothetical protein EBT11_00600 [bacterium]|nr:hypothetical protein [bacterium]